MAETRPPKVFISYAWEDDLKTWVLDFATRLRSDGINAILDQWETVPGDQLPEFMEKSVRESDFVVFVCTPTYKRKSDRRKGGVGYEGHIITGEVFQKNNHRKFIPVLRKGKWGSASPSWATSKLFIDFSGDPYGESNYQQLLDTLFGRLPIAPPLRDDTFREKIEREAAEWVERERLEREAAEKIAREKEGRETAEKLAQEKIAREKEAKEKAEQEAIEKIAREKAEREAAEKVAREKAEKATRDKLERDAAEKAKREKEERQNARKAVLAKTISDFLVTLKSTLPKAKPVLTVIGIIGIIIVLFWVVPPFPPPPPATPSSTPTSIPPEKSTPTEIPYETEIRDAKGVVMRFVRAGEFIRGSNDPDYPDEHPIDQIFVGNFYIDKFEVTNLLYRVCVIADACKEPTIKKYYDDMNYENHPVVYVNWEMAKDYCTWRGNGTRLPSEAEWEKAAHGKFRQTYPWTQDFGGVMANYDNKNNGTLPVSSYPNGVSPYGVYNMAGNVREWVFDWYDVYLGGDPNASVYFGELFRVVRGGSWKKDVTFIRTASRDFARSMSAGDDIGFRCARSVP